MSEFLGVKVVPRDILDENHPGHMTVYWTEHEYRHFRGFRFFVDDLPEEFRHPSKYRGYLFDNQVDGYIVNDHNFKNACEKFPDFVLFKKWEFDRVELRRFASSLKPSRYGFYSFNPDNFPNCYNCVSWAIKSVNSLGRELLKPVRQGRIKEIINQLQS